VVRVPRAIHDEMVAHARDELPNEACGLLAGHGERVTHAFRAHNKEQSRVRYEIDPQDLIRLFRTMCDARLEHVGIYHSHTHSEAYPSATDIRLAYYPDALYFIVSLMNREAPRVRAFRIREGRVSEEPIDIV
jgi:proteasome lid subunit RPN8/RPN11